MAEYTDPYEPAKPQRTTRAGSRNRLARRFFNDTLNAWEELGESAIRRAAFHDPMGFVNMVARLMPQKIEHTTPTSGMTDERIEELMAIADAAVRGSGVVIEGVTHEKPLSLSVLGEGGGGPIGVEPSLHENMSSTTPDRLQPASADMGIPITPSEFSGPALTGEEANSVSTSTPLPYPVGHAMPVADHVIEARNRRVLAADEVDPDSLF